MSHQTKPESDAFQQQDVEEIVAELQLESDELVRALMELRLSPSPALRERVQMITETERAEERSQASERRREQKLPLLSRLVLRAGVVTMVLLVAVLLLIATVPSVRAALSNVMQQRFGLVLVAPTPEVMPATETKLEEGEMLTEATIPPVSLAEAQAQTPFTIPLPTTLPEGFELRAARVGAGPHGESRDENGNRIIIEAPIQVILTFKPDEDSQNRYHAEATLSLHIMDGTGLAGGYAVPAEREQEIEVNGNSAVFVKGAWMRSDENKSSSPGELIWDDTSNSAMLSWEGDGFTYIIIGSHLGLSREDYIRIAESIP